MSSIDNWVKDSARVAKVLSRAPSIDKTLRVEKGEFLQRQREVIAALAKADLDAAFVYSDEHYNGDVPYLGGNTNYSIEQVAFGLGPDALRSAREMMRGSRSSGT